MNGDDAGYLSLLVNVTRGIPDFSDASEMLNFARERALPTRLATVAEYFMLSMLCIVVVCKYDTPKWTLMKRLQRQLPQNDLLYLVVFRFGLPECLEIRKRWYFNAFAILQVVTGYDCMERNVTVFVCGLYAVCMRNEEKAPSMERIPRKGLYGYIWTLSQRSDPY